MSFLQDDASLWLPGLIEAGEVMKNELIPDAWPKCREYFGGTVCHEDRVTQRLVNELLKSKRQLYPNLAFRIVFQYYVFPSDDEAGKIDFAVLLGGNDEQYLGYECKWLLKDNEPGIGGYLGSDGVGCFVSGKYGPQMPLGFMVGYVASGSVEEAVEKLHKGFERWKMPLPESHREDRCLQLFETSHSRDGNFPNITLTHILLSFSPDSENTMQNE